MRMRKNLSTPRPRVVLTALLLLSLVSGCALFRSETAGPRTSGAAAESAPEAVANEFEAGGEDWRPKGAWRPTPRPSGRAGPAGSAAAAAGGVVATAGAAAGPLASPADPAAEAAAEAGAEGVVEGVPPVGAGRDAADEVDSRRPVWLAMLLVIFLGLLAIWLSRRQAG